MRVAVLALGAIVVAGCGRGAATVGRDGDVQAELARARSSSQVLYYAGPSFAGLPIGHVEVAPRFSAIMYGTCVIPAGSDGGCGVPVQIQISPFSGAQWRNAVGCARRPSIRGVPTIRQDGLVLFTGRVVVRLYARSRREERRLARALRRVQDDVLPARLPPPSAAVAASVARVCR